MGILAPSILSADFTNLKQQIELAEAGGADWIHCDIMDGHYVPNITFGPIVVKAARRCTKLPLDVHLMIENADKYIEDFVKAGADYLTVHQEAVVHLDRTINYIKSFGIKAGVSLNPATPVNTLKDVASQLDLLLIMSVNPGFGGQSFIKNSLNKLREAVKLREECGGSFVIEIDGGMSRETIKSAFQAGAEAFVAGSSIFNSDDISAAAKELKTLITK